MFLLWSEWPFLFSHSVPFRNRQWYLTDTTCFALLPELFFKTNKAASRIFTQLTTPTENVSPSFAKVLQLPSQSGQLLKICSDRPDPSKKFQKDLKKRDTSHSKVPTYVKYAQVSFHVPECSYMRAGSAQNVFFLFWWELAEGTLTLVCRVK